MAGTFVTDVRSDPFGSTQTRMGSLETRIDLFHTGLRAPSALPLQGRHVSPSRACCLNPATPFEIPGHAKKSLPLFLALPFHHVQRVCMVCLDQHREADHGRPGRPLPAASGTVRGSTVGQAPRWTGWGGRIRYRGECPARRPPEALRPRTRWVAGFRMSDTLAVFPLEGSRRSDFYRVHSESQGCGWCCCAAWWAPTWGGWGERTAAQNRALRDSLLDRGEYDGYLLYSRGEPVGWCQVGPRDRLEKLVRQLRLESDPAVWAITCFLISPSRRREGLARRLLAEVLRDLQHRGIRRVEAYPRRGSGLMPDDLWTGPEALFLGEGFTVLRDDPARPVLSRSL